MPNKRNQKAARNSERERKRADSAKRRERHAKRAAVRETWHADKTPTTRAQTRRSAQRGRLAADALAAAGITAARPVGSRTTEARAGARILAARYTPDVSEPCNGSKDLPGSADAASEFSNRGRRRAKRSALRSRSRRR
jgi:hypothetical protein